MVLSNAALQQANAIAQEQTKALYQQISAAQEQSQWQIGAVPEKSQRLFEQLATAAEADRKTLTKVAETLAQWAPVEIKDIGSKPSAIHVARFLSKMTTDDDPEAFLLTFEQAAGGKVGLKPSGQD